ncbi:S-adenosyl-L-methionine-dependent methyltransferase [Rhypophila sp. PSN 637]
MAPNPATDFPPLSELAMTVFFPWQFMFKSMTYLPGTLLHALKNRDLATLFSWSKLQAAWFGRFWAWAGPQVRQGAEVTVVPLLEGRITSGAVISPSNRSTAVHPGISGTVLEIGPGSGMWVSIFSDKYQSSPASSQDQGQPGHRGRVTRVYGVEPNPAVHPLLRQQIAKADLQDVYEVVPVGIEDLASSGRVAPQSVDCIVSVLCLCSIPQPEHNIKELCNYLKPGGRWYVYEHVKRERSNSWAVALYQAFVNLFWPHIIGGCELQRETGKWLKEAGPWSDIDLVSPKGEPWFMTLPHLVGVLTK